MMVALTVYAMVAVAFRLKEVRRDIGSVLVIILSNTITIVLSLLALWKTQGWRIDEALTLIQDPLGGEHSQYFGFASWEIIVFFSQI